MASLVERIWRRDATVWTGADEDRWLAWLDEPGRMRARVDELTAFAETTVDGLDACVLLGMGGSSLAPEVLRRVFGVETFHVLDTTHPAAIRRLEAELELESTLFLVSSKSGTTIETRSQLAYFWERAGGVGERFVAITDPGSELEALARGRGFRAVFAGVPEIGGRYSALSAFGLVPAALMGVDLDRLLDRAHEMAEACRLERGNPGLELGLELGEGWRAGRDKVCFPNPDGFGLWLEQLLAESTGKQGKGLVPAPGESGEGADRQRHELRLADAYELGQEFFRWEFATAVAGHVLEINPFDQPDVQAAKDATAAVLAGGQTPGHGPVGDVGELLEGVRPGDYVAVQAFVDPAREDELAPLLARARATGAVVTCGLGPRYLHSTGQLHKGGPDSVVAIQVVDDLGPEVPIPGSDFGFRRLIEAQAAGDLAALRERGRRAARIGLEDIER